MFVEATILTELRRDEKIASHAASLVWGDAFLPTSAFEEPLRFEPIAYQGNIMGRVEVPRGGGRKISMK